VREADPVPTLIEAVELLVLAPLALSRLRPRMATDVVGVFRYIDATHGSTHRRHYFGASLHGVFRSS